MAMTVGLFESFVAEMESLSAERLLDAARASVAQFWQSDQWDRLIGEAMGQPAVDAAPARSVAATGFWFNGQPLSFDALQTRMAGALETGAVSA